MRFKDEEAERLCSGCPVKAICLESALDEERGKTFALRDGYRGGTTPFRRYLMELEEKQVYCSRGLHPLWETAVTNGNNSCGCGACAGKHSRKRLVA